MDRGAIAVFFAACVAAATIAPATAQTTKQLDECTGKVFAKPDDVITGCVAVLRSGRWTKKSDAFAYDNIGRALQSKGDIDKAIDSYSHAIADNPEFRLSYRN